MTFFVVSYDLKKNKDYQTLWDEMARLKGHKPQLARAHRLQAPLPPRIPS
jgi:hypothetical protein